jgi:hypothetical protein
MPRAFCIGVEIEYETLRKPSDPPLLLIIVLATELIRWPDPFCQTARRSGPLRDWVRQSKRGVEHQARRPSCPEPCACQRSASGRRPRGAARHDRQHWARKQREGPARAYTNGVTGFGSRVAETGDRGVAQARVRRSMHRMEPCPRRRIRGGFRRPRWSLCLLPYVFARMPLLPQGGKALRGEDAGGGVAQPHPRLRCHRRKARRTPRGGDVARATDPTLGIETGATPSWCTPSPSAAPPLIKELWESNPNWGRVPHVQRR